MNCKLVGRWRIVEADIWDHQYLDLCGPATIVIRANGRGEIAFGALQAGLDIEYSRASVGFTWEGFDEMDEVSGDGSAELLDDGSNRDRIRLSQRRRSRSQSQAGYFFNSLLVVVRPVPGALASSERLPPCDQARSKNEKLGSSIRRPFCDAIRIVRCETPFLRDRRNCA